MMRDEMESLYEELARAPEDWSVRLRLVERAVSGGDFEEARRLVRSSPDEDQFLPAELQDRIHALLSGGPRWEGSEGDGDEEEIQDS